MHIIVCIVDSEFHSQRMPSHKETLCSPFNVHCCKMSAISAAHNVIQHVIRLMLLTSSLVHVAAQPQAKAVPVTMNEMLLRGCTLKNTGHILGLAIYTGNETRIQKNSAKTPNKIGGSLPHTTKDSGCWRSRCLHKWVS